MRLRALLIIMSLTISLIPIGIIGGFQGFEIATVSLGLILIVILIVSFMMSSLITMPIKKLTKNIEVISKGNLDVGLEKSEIYEINNLINSLKRVMVSLKLAIYKVGITKEDIFEETMKEKNAAESRYTSLLKVVDGWIWEIDNNGVWQFCSEKIFDSLGYQPSEIVGKNIFEYLDSKEKIKLKKILKSSTTKTDENETTNIELNFRHKSGDNVLFVSSIVPFYDDSYDFLGFRGMSKKISDISHEKIRVEEKTPELKKEELIIPEKKEKVVTPPTRSPVISTVTKKDFDYYFFFDSNTNIVECSKNMTEKLGYNRDEILSLNLEKLDCFEKKDNIKNKVVLVKDKGKMNFKTMYRKKDQRIILVIETIRYLKDMDLFECLVKEEAYTKHI
ncbi:MAG: PAS domain S-box protein [Thermoplasmatales archaeon]|nr:MAG: PAS domain S-box protein [Thermoplasmatales archaeon]